MNTNEYILKQIDIIEKWSGVKISLSLFRHCVDHCIYCRVRTKMKSTMKNLSLSFLFEIRDRLKEMMNEQKNRVQEPGDSSLWGEAFPKILLDRYPDE